MSSLSYLKVVLLYNRSNPFGLKKDAAFLDQMLRKKVGIVATHADPLEPPIQADVAIHLEQPVYVWQSWARVNILIVNPEWYVPEAYNSYMEHFDIVVFKNQVARSRFIEAGVVSEEKSTVLPWANMEMEFDGTEKTNSEPGMGFACFLGGSRNRHEMLKEILPFWRDSYPQLNIFTIGGIDVPEQSNISVRKTNLEPAQHAKLAKFFPGHLIVSKSEGFSYTAAEAEEVGAFSIMNTLDAFQSTYERDEGIAWLPTVEKRSDEKHSLSLQATIGDKAEFQEALDKAIENFSAIDFTTCREIRSSEAKYRREEFGEKLATLMKSTMKYFPQRKKQPRPPILKQEDCPPISIVTLMYNRHRFFDLACHNIMISDYPKDKIEWIIVDDSDDPNEQAADKIVAVQQKSDPLRMVYLPLQKKTPISQKRNLGIQKASHDIILMMDDDDHYPETSFRRRVAWLTQHSWQPKAVACTTIACYDLVKAISAVNSPPLDIPLSQRISEATLTFYKSWWEEQKFERDIQVGEGETFLRGREKDVLEIPPQQIIVAFSHGKNTSSRRVPDGPDVNPGCFWGFPKEYLIFIHGLAGIKIEERNA